MNVFAWASFLSAWMLGFLVVAICRPADRALRDDLFLTLALGLLIGLGTSSGLFFLASLLSGQPARLAGALELILGIGLWWTWGRRCHGAKKALIPRVPGSWMQVLLATLLVQMVLIAATTSWRAYRAEPYGGWDGWAIWNLHARFMLRAGTEWPSLLAAPQLSWTHPDYPRLLPAAVARIWAWSGAESPAAAALISVSFAIATIGVLIAVTNRLRGPGIALVGGALLVGTPFFVTFSSNQHADIPLSGFMLAAVALAVLGARETSGAAGRFTLAGICAGFAAGTKNEGVLFAVVFLALGGWLAWRNGGWRSGAFLLGGMLGAALPVMVFKAGFAPDNDLTAAMTARLPQVFDGTRHQTILAAGGRALGQFGEWSVLPYLVMVLPFFAWRNRTRLSGGETLPLLTLGVMLAGYYGVYLLSPHDLTWHLNTSLVRLLLQLWPLALLWWCLAAPREEATAVPSLGTKWKPVVFLSANLAAAVSLVWGLSCQLAPNELTRGSGRLSGVTVAYGDGWFPPERQGKDRWAWTGTRAVLLLHRNGEGPAKTVAIRFRVRAFGLRHVLVKQGEQILWRSALPDGFTAVELGPLSLPAGITRLEFSTDTPGQPESAVGGRKLGFAVYNLELRQSD